MLAFPMGFYIDRLSAVMMVLISGVGTIIYTYSIGYMYQDPNDRRYLALIAFTTSVLLCMVSSANLMMLFLFWQILSYMLYLLAHNHAHAATLDGAFRTFTLLRVGDVAFLSGIVLAHQLYGTLEFQALFAKAAESPITLTPLPGIEIGGATAVTLLLFIGAMSKSAQFPIHIWLPRSLYAPTPVHALLHAGIINAGGFLINRLAPLYGLSSTTLHVAFVVGMVTAVLGATTMLAQNDIKKTLGFSTIGQMGYMIMECGLGAFSLAVFHLIAHGLFKATVFLSCGNVIHKARQEPEFPHAEPCRKRRGVLAPDLGDRISHDTPHSACHPPGVPWCVAHPVAGFPRDRDLPVLYLGHVLPSHLDAHPPARSRFMEGISGDAADTALRRVHLFVRRRVLHRIPLSESGRGRVLLPGGGAPQLAL